MKLFRTLLVATATLLPAFAAAVPTGSKIFIEPMEGDLNGYIQAEILKQKLPVTVVLTRENADYAVQGGSQSTGDSGVLFTGRRIYSRDNKEGNVTLYSIKDGALVWSAEAGDRSLVFSEFRRSGNRKIADRIVHQMKKDLFQE